MTPEDVKGLIEAGMPDAQLVRVSGDGSHFDAIVVSPAFDGKSPVAKQQMVYSTVNERIASGDLHALSIKTYTPQEWDKVKDLQVL